MVRTPTITHPLPSFHHVLCSSEECDQATGLVAPMLIIGFVFVISLLLLPISFTPTYRTFLFYVQMVPLVLSPSSIFTPRFGVFNLQSDWFGEECTLPLDGMESVVFPFV